MTQEEKTIYTYEEAFEKSKEYFRGDELAAKVFVDKYALRDYDNNILEDTPDKMHHRIATELYRIEKNKFKNPMPYDEIYSCLKDFKYIIPQGSGLSGIGNYYQYTSLSNCYVASSPLDSYSSICKTDEEIVSISKRRGGIGFDISNLRPAGTPTTNAAKTSTGIIPFCERYSNTIREVGQNSRRGALILTLSVHHPEILGFINMKQNSTKITGANISVRLTNEFLNAVKKDKDYELRWPVDSDNPTILKKIKAKEIWDAIIHSAWSSAEPGLLFWDNIIEESPADCYKDLGFKTVSVNPCITGDTMICTDKGNISIIDIIKNGINNYKIMTYNNDKNKIELENILWADKTREYTDIIEIELEDGSKLSLTPDHEVYTKNRGYVKAFDLNEEDILIKIKKNKIIEKRIKKITVKSNEDVYDLTTSKNHNFFANNILVHNCSELSLSVLDSCRLLLLNLFSFVENPFTNNAEFNFDKFYKYAQIAQRFMDDIVDLELEHVERIIKKIKKDPEPDNIKRDELETWIKIKKSCAVGRRTGTGANAVGDVIASCGLKYGSKKSIELLDKIFKTLKLGCYRSSVDMAKELGPFEIWDHKLEKNCPFLLRIKDEDEKLWNDMKKYGRRNIGLLTLAPSGSVSIETQTSSGIEPIFQITYIRRKKIDANDNKTKADFIDESGDRWQEFKVYHPKFNNWTEITGETDIEKSPWFNSCAEDINWTDRVKLQAMVNRHIDHSISSCLSPNSLIETNNGLLYMHEIFNFDEIPVGNFYKNKNYIKVLNHEMKSVNLDEFYNNGEQHVLSMKLLNGLQISCTHNEKFIVLNDETGLEEWKKISEIKEGDRVKIKNIDHSMLE